MGFNASALSANTIKTFVDRLNKRNKEKTTWPPKRSAVQEDIANVLGYASWHALNKALDTPKPQSIENPPASIGTWTIPSMYHNGDIMWSRYEWNKHCLVFGDDDVRSAFFERFAAANPDRPMLFIQGPLALPLSNWSGEQVENSTDLMNVMIGSLDFSHATADELYATLALWVSTHKSYVSHTLKVVVNALVELRDNTHFELNLKVLLQYLRHPHLIQELSVRTDFSEKTLKNLQEYVQIEPMIKESLISQFFVFRALEEHTPCSNASVLINHKNLLQNAMKSYLDQWSKKHPGGLIVVDGLHSNSELYEFLLMRLAVYKRDGVGVVVGCTSSADFPNPQMFKQIEQRMGNSVDWKRT